jgi:hypothetical protein
MSHICLTVWACSALGSEPRSRRIPKTEKGDCPEFAGGTRFCADQNPNRKLHRCNCRGRPNQNPTNRLSHRRQAPLLPRENQIIYLAAKNVARTAAKPRRAEPNCSAAIRQLQARSQQPKRIGSFPAGAQSRAHFPWADPEKPCNRRWKTGLAQRNFWEWKGSW